MSKKNNMIKRFAIEDMENGREMPIREVEKLENIVRRIQLSMTCFGMYYKSKDVSVPEEGKMGYKPSKLIFYNIIVLLLLWACLVKTIVALFYIEEFDTGKVMLKLIGVCWQVQVTLNATIMVKASHPTRGNQCSTYRYYSTKVLTKLKELDIKMDSTGMNRKLLIGFIMGWCCIGMNIGVVIVIFVLPQGIVQDTVISLFLSPLPSTTVTKIVLVILQAYCSVAWIQPVLYFITLSIVLKYAFESCQQALQDDPKANKTDKNNRIFPERLSEIRRLHLDLCETVELLDRDFNYLLANLYMTSIPLACFIVYSLVRTQPDLFHTIVYIFWGLSGNFCVLFASGFAASVHKSAHGLQKQMYDTSLNGATFENFGQVYMFLSKLTGPSIGFTVLDFFVVTKEILLTVGGLFLTYVFLLIQF